MKRETVVSAAKPNFKRRKSVTLWINEQGQVRAKGKAKKGEKLIATELGTPEIPGWLNELLADYYLTD
jgi:hypothetical protein